MEKKLVLIDANTALERFLAESRMHNAYVAEQSTQAIANLRGLVEQRCPACGQPYNAETHPNGECEEPHFVRMLDAFIDKVDALLRKAVATRAGNA